MEENNSQDRLVCETSRFAYWTSNCCLRMNKFGDVLIKSRFNSCPSPPLLDVSVQIDQHTWQLSFVSDNARESRLIGLEHWPLRVHVSFFDSLASGKRSVLACVEALKNGQQYCFLNGTVTGNLYETAYYPCATTTGGDLYTTTFIAGATLVLSLLLIVTVAGFAVICRRFRRRSMLDDRHQQKLNEIVPSLPNAKPYGEPISGGISTSIVAQKTSSANRLVTLNPITEEESIDCSRTESGEARSILNVDNRWRQSKLVQTSLNSLSIQLLETGPPSDSSSAESTTVVVCERSDTMQLLSSSSSDSYP